MRVVVAGAGTTGRRLVARLVADRHDVTVIDLSHEVCELISAKLGATAVRGSATDIAILEEAELAQADVAVALMGDSAANLAFSLLARGMGVPRIVARMPNPQYRTAYEQAGVTGIIDLAGLFIDAVILEIEHPQVQQVGVFADGQGIVIALYASKPNRGLGKTAAQIHSDKRFPRGCLIAGIVRNGKVIIPPGPTAISPGDEIILSARTDTVAAAVEYFGGKLSPFHRRKSIPNQAELEAMIEADKPKESD